MDNSYDIVANKEVEIPELAGASVATRNSDNISGKVHSGTTLEWKGIKYVIPAKDNTTGQVGDRVILNNLSGVARPGELLAVMGTSGAGKSTLLDVLAGRLDSPNLMGQLLTNGKAVDKKSFRKETGYVMQSDALFPLLTVRETIRYAAYLRIANKTTAEKNEIAENIIKLLRLEKCADTIIGDDDNRGLSGGEKRRVSIGVDIVHFPAVIFLDEPTSGLDSTTAMSVMESLKTLAVQQNCTVIMTIHQPSARLFSILDQVMFLSYGNITYYGNSHEVLSYADKLYEEAGMGKAPAGNPPEVFLDLCDTLQAEGRIQLVTDQYTHKTEEVTSSRLVVSDKHGDDSVYANSMLEELITLCSRAMKNIIRTKELFVGRLFASIFFGILIGTLFLNTDNDNTKDLNLRLSYFVFTIAFYYYTSLEALPIFLGEREIFMREYSRGAYRALSYTITSTIVQLPFQFLLALVYNCITWYLVGFNNDANLFFFQVLCTFTVIATGATFANMMSVLVPNPMAGQTAGSGLFSVMFLFSGFFIKKDDIPKYWYWLHYSSLFKYAYDSMLINAFEDNASTPDMTNDQVLDFYSVNDSTRGQGVGILWAWLFFFRLVFYYRLVTAFSGSRK